MSDSILNLPVRDQGERPTCVAHAVSDAHALVRGEHQLLAADYLHYLGAERMQVSINDAISLTAALASLKEEGQPLEADCPYSPTPRPVKWKPPTAKTLWTCGSSLIDPKRLCDTLTTASPLVLTLALSPSFFTPVNGSGEIKEDSVLLPALHAVLALEVRTDGHQSLVLLRNSWGEAWGANGYAWASVSYLAKRLRSVASIS